MNIDQTISARIKENFSIYQSTTIKYLIRTLDKINSATTLIKDLTVLDIFEWYFKSKHSKHSLFLTQKERRKEYNRNKSNHIQQRKMTAMKALHFYF